MRKIATPPTLMFTLAQRADITITRHAADLLTELLMKKEALRRKWREADFRQEIKDYSVVAVMAIATGTLFSLVTTFTFMR